MADDKIIKKLSEHDDRFRKVDERFDKIDERFDKIDERLDNFRQEFLHGQDQMMTILKRLDEERIFTLEWVKRIESKVETQKQELEKQKAEINKIKLELKIA
jgi:chromosome segregation ATPase